MFVSFVSLLVALAPSSAAPRAALAAVEFRPPPTFREVETRPPALWEGTFSEGAAERARMVLFVVPARTGASRAERIERALDVAAVYARPLAREAAHDAAGASSFDDERASLHLLEIVSSSGLETARLVLARLDGRTAGLLLTGGAEAVDALSDELRAAAATIETSSRIHPPEPGEPVEDRHLGFRFRPPFGFETARGRTTVPRRGDAVEPWRFALPPHLGLGAEVELTVLDAWQDAPFDAVGRALRDALSEEGTVDVPRAARLGPLPAIQLEHEDGSGRRHVLHCVELHGRRLLLQHSAPAVGFERFRPAFTESAASFEAIERRVEARLGPLHEDPVLGFSLRPPEGFHVSETSADAITFSETDRVPPRQTLVVLRREPPSDQDDRDACVAWAVASAAADPEWALDGTPRPLVLNGRRGAHTVLVDPHDSSRRQDRWSVAGSGGAHELRFTSTRGERALYLDAVLASVRTFRPFTPR